MNKRPRPYRSGYRIATNSGSIKIVLLNYPDKTLWQTLKDFINNLEINEKFTRKEIIKHIYVNEIYNSKITIDTYRNLLTNIGILKIVGVGRYVKLKDIPKSLDTKLLKKIANKKSWESWFIPIEYLDKGDEYK